MEDHLENEVIRVGGREWAEALDADPETAVISIHTPGDAPAALAEGWKDVLRLAFHDVDPVRYEGHDKLTRHAAQSMQAFTPHQAQQILGFLGKHKGGRFVIHCDAGVSRSVAVGRFAATLLGVPVVYEEGLGDQLYNAHVHATLVRGLMAPEEE